MPLDEVKKAMYSENSRDEVRASLPPF